MAIVSGSRRQLENQIRQIISRNGNVSRQPQYQSDYVSTVGIPFGRVLKYAHTDIPEYQPDSRELDAWMQTFLLREPHLNGVVGQAVNLVGNRPWTIVGGRNSAMKVQAIFQDADRPEKAPHGKGWRSYIDRGARSYYTTCMGFVSENGRDGETQIIDGVEVPAPLRAVWSVDSTKCRLTGDPGKPLEYYPAKGKSDKWEHSAFFRVVPNPGIREEYLGLGVSPAYICLELAKILVAVYEYDQEQLGSRAPKGLLLLQNITEDMWDDAMAAREATLSQLERQYYGGVAVLASPGIETIDAKLIALSNLPKEWDRQTMIDLIMFLYALAFGYPPEEFWPVRFGGLSRGTETKVNMERATRKGDSDFFVRYQDQIQKELPANVLMEFEERDDNARLIAAQVADAQASVIETVARTLYEVGNVNGPLVDKGLVSQIVLNMMVEADLIPPEYSEMEEEVTAEDTGEVRMKQLRGRLKETEQVMRAARDFPKEPIVMYQWPTNRYKMLWESGESVYARHSWPVLLDLERPKLLSRTIEVERQGEVYYDDGEIIITEEDVDLAIELAEERVGPEVAELLAAETMTAEEIEAWQESSS